MTDQINKTQLNIERATDRGIIHRDYAAHYFRWSFALRFIDFKDTVLDLGSGNGMLAQVLYVNKYKPTLYVAVDIREKALDEIKNRKVNFPIETHCLNVNKQALPYNDKFFSVICCFEMVEHFEPKYLKYVLSEAKRVLKDDGVMLLSTPNYDGKHQASNHIHEYTEIELQNYISQHFAINKMFGTFASKKDIYPILSSIEKELYDKLSGYYDSNVMSNIFAPLYPHNSRNILWVLKHAN